MEEWIKAELSKAGETGWSVSRAIGQPSVVKLRKQVDGVFVTFAFDEFADADDRTTEFFLNRMRWAVNEAKELRTL